MARLYLVRHGQASFGTHDYDRLSSVGAHQAQQAGRYLATVATNELRIVSGSLVRQRDTAAEIARCLPASHVVQIDERLNEIDIDPHLAPNLMKRAFLRWQSSSSHPVHTPEDWTMFASRVRAALEHLVRTSHRGETTIVVSSGGVISTVVQQVLALPPQSVYSLFEVMRNCSVTCLLHDRERISLSSFNECSYLATELLTYR